MVHFGHYIQAHRIPGWETYYIGYKHLKKKINEYAIRAAGASDEERQNILKKFSKLLDSQVEKIVLFIIEKQGLLAGKLQQLREITESDFSDEHSGLLVSNQRESLIEGYRLVGKELLDLLQYSEMNIMGLRKILKKFDKRLGVRLREHYLMTRINHPYSQIQQVLRQVGIRAIIATISRNLAELQCDTWKSYSSLSLINHVPKIGAVNEPIVKAIESEFQRLTNEATLLTFIANTFLLQAPEEVSDISVEEREYHAPSAYINLLNTFLYMVNYYIIVPTSDEYAELLEMPATLSGIIIGAMPLMAAISAFLFSWWSNKSYKAPLIWSTLMLIAGNIMYALALPYNSVWLLLLGRCFEGLGCARAVNRRYIVHEVPFSKVRNFSAAFVSASALGMSLGPAAASILNSIDFQVMGISVNYCTSPGWLLGLSWSVYLAFVLLFFKEPKKQISMTSKASVPSLSSESRDSQEPSLTDTLLIKIDEDDRDDNTYLSTSNAEHDDASLLTKEKAVTNDTSAGTLWDVLSDLTLPIQILLVIYFMLKFTSEMLISEATLVTTYYFGWSSSKVGYFLGGLGLTVLPSSAVVANYISNRFEERSIILWNILLTGIGVLGILCYCPYIKYTEAQYISASLVIFIATNVLEGVDMSLLSKMLSPRLSHGVFNCGFLSTEAGTIARAVADGLITLVGKVGMQCLLNYTMLPTLVIVIATLAFTWFGYYSLY